MYRHNLYFAFVLLNNTLEFDRLKDKVKGIITIKTLNSSFWGLKELMDYGNVQKVIQQQKFL